MLNIKPILHAYRGETGAAATAMGYESGLEKIFETAKGAIDEGLSINAITMSYAGDLDEIRQEKGYRRFVDHAEKRGVPTFLTMMSTTAAVNVGPGSFALSYAE